jgi:uncharacterized caspase-like protein
MAFKNGHALVIGVGSHQHVPALNVPITVADAQAVARVLGDEAYCGYPQEQVTLLHDDTATREGILGALDRLVSSLQESDTLFIFYSGHGEYGSDGEYYLVSNDVRVADRKVVPGTGVNHGALLEALARIPARRVLMVFNACHSGEISPTLGAEDDLGAKSLPGAAADALLGTGSGRVIITACREAQYSYIGKGERTLFAQALVDGLRGVDVLPRGGFISAYDLYASLYDSVSDKVQNLYQRQQEPELTVLKGVGPFAVALYRGAVDTSLSAAEAEQEPPSGTAVRQVRPEKAQRLFQQQIGVQIGSISDVRDSQINIAGRDVIQTVDTGGGSYNPGGVKTGGGDFVGRDKVVHGDEVHGDKVGGDKFTVGDISGSSGIAIGRGAQASVSYGLDADEIDKLFQPVLQAISQAPQGIQAEALRQVKDLKKEAAKGESANDGLMASLLNELKKLVPGAVGALAQAFASPALQKAAGDLTRLVLNTFR